MHPISESIDIDPFIDANDMPWFKLGLDRAIPALLRRLASEDHNDRLDALGELDDRIFPDGDLNYASAPVGAFLARLALHPATEDVHHLIRGINALLSIACELPETDLFGPPVIRAVRPYLPALFALRAADQPDLRDAIDELEETWSTCRHA